MASLTVIVHTKNVASTLKDCLGSVQKLANEIIVMDMESTDDTLKIARQFGAKILKHADLGTPDPARNQALAAANSDWTLVLDADETLSTHLQQQIPQLIVQAEKQNISAYAFPRRNIMFGHFVRGGWWPDYQRRLFKTGTVNWPAQLHGVPQVKGQLKQLPAEEKWAIIHHNYTNVAQFIDKANRYSTIAAQERSKHPEQSKPANLLEIWWEEFVSRWFAKNGQAQPTIGQVTSLLQAFFEVLAQIKTWEKLDFPPQPAPKISTFLKKAYQDALYWEANTKIHSSRGVKKLYWTIRRKLKI